MKSRAPEKSENSNSNSRYLSVVSGKVSKISKKEDLSKKTIFKNLKK